MQNYDIDGLIRAHAKPAKVLFAMWEILSSCPDRDLLPTERVILHGWSFDSTMGNGIVDLIRNEAYDTIAEGLQALRQLGDPTLSAFAREIDEAFRRHGVRSDSEEEIAKLENLSDSARDHLERDLACTEHPFRDKIWKGEIIIDRLWVFVEKSLPMLRVRK
jgi:hypothetical protein